MKLQTCVIPEHRADIGLAVPHLVTLPAVEHTWAPTLSQVHTWLFDGPFYQSWRDGDVCPFARGKWRTTYTCNEHRRKSCYGLLTDRGRVICYPWSHRLAAAYWNLANADLLALPDDPELVAITILRRVLRAAGWWVWRQERRRRAIRGYEWLEPLAPHQRIPHSRT